MKLISVFLFLIFCNCLNGQHFDNKVDSIENKIVLLSNNVEKLESSRNTDKILEIGMDSFSKSIDMFGAVLTGISLILGIVSIFLVIFSYMFYSSMQELKKEANLIKEKVSEEQNFYNDKITKTNEELLNNKNIISETVKSIEIDTKELKKEATLIKEKVSEEQIFYKNEMEKIRLEILKDKDMISKILVSFEEEQTNLDNKLTKMIKEVQVTNHYDKGTKLYYENSYDKAIEALEKVIEIDEGHEDALNLIGLSYQHMEQYEKAIKYYEKAIECNPTYARTYNNISYAYCNMGRFETAIEYILKALDSDKNYNWAWSTYAEIKSLLHEKYPENEIYLNEFYSHLEQAITLGYPIWQTQTKCYGFKIRQNEDRFIELLHKYKHLKFFAKLKVASQRDERGSYTCYAIGFKNKMKGVGNEYNDAYRDLQKKFTEYVDKNGDKEFLNE